MLSACVVCGAPLSARTSARGGLCCSLVCRGKRRTQLARDKYLSERCCICGRTLSILQACRKGKYCSSRCYNTSRRKELYYVKCVQCGTELTKDQQGHYNKFCSHDCSVRHGLIKHDYGYNSSFVEDTNSEQFSYFLGLWTADGALSKQRQVSLGLVDKQIILDLAQATGYTRNISKHLQKIATWNPRYVLTYAGPLATKLIMLGYAPGAKSGKEFIPSCINKNNLLHFTRGLIDGDGNLDISRRRGYLCITVSVESKQFLTDLLRRLQTLGVIHRGTVYKAGNKVHVLKLSHYDSLSLCKAMYKNASLFLHRKYDKYRSVTTVGTRVPAWSV